MSTTNQKQSFVKSKTFIISTSLALVFLTLFLVFVTIMKSRYDFCWKVITEYMNKIGNYDSMYEESLVWKIFLMPQSSLGNTIETEHGNMVLSEQVIKTLTWYISDWSNNLTFTVLTIITIFATVITGFIPLSWCIAKLSEQKVAKKKSKKQKQENNLDAKGN